MVGRWRPGPGSQRSPGALWLVTVRLPVTATASAGTPPRPVTWKVRADVDDERTREAGAIPRVEQAGRVERDVRGARGVGHEVAGDVEEEGGRAQAGPCR